MADTPPPDLRALLQQAYAALREVRGRLAETTQKLHAPVAVVGMGCRFPGGVRDPAGYWELLRAGTDAITEVPADRWDINALYDPDPDVPGKMSTRWGGFLSDIADFDAAFFGITPREAEAMDPQQRLLLEVCWEALEDAGHAPMPSAGSRTGVFVGITASEYLYRLRAALGHERLDAYVNTGGVSNVAAGRIAYAFGLTGPALAVDTACSSSLTAVHLACQSLRRGECDAAIAAGVNLVLGPETSIEATKGRAMAPDGRCKTFSAAADGYVRSEGCGAVVLRLLADAERDGDRILAVIRGSATNQDGRTSGLTVPNGLAQQAVIRAALADAGIEPSAVGYVECHGTGTSLGDPIEVEALAAVLGSGRSAQAPLWIGSAKTNLGHAESAAGMTGLIKLVLCLQHRALPPSLHFDRPSPHIPWDRIPLAVPRALTAWDVPAGARRVGGVSGFGYSGTNVHVVIEEPSPRAAPVTAGARPVHVLTLSARSEAALGELAERTGAALATRPELDLADVAFTTTLGRAHLPHRLAVVAREPASAVTALRAAAAGQKPAWVHRGQVVAGPAPKVAFLFTGQGAQVAGMGRELYETQPVFRAALDACDAVLRPLLRQPLLSVLYPRPGETTPIDRTEYAQPALFAVEYALAELWRSWGVKPSAVLGHSVGEYVAACVAGVFSLEQGLKLIAERGRLMQALPEGGAMVSVSAPVEQVEPMLADLPGRDQIDIAAINSPRDMVLSGAREVIDAAVARLAAAGIRTRALRVSHAFHSPALEPMLDAFEEAARGVAYAPPAIGLVSNLTGALFPAGTAPDARYFRRHARGAVRFAAGAQQLHERGYRVFIEIGPGNGLLTLVRRSVPEVPELAFLSSRDAGHGAAASLGEALAELYVRGVSVDWAGVAAGGPGRRVALPTYPFRRQRYWLLPPVGAEAPAGSGSGIVARPAPAGLLGVRVQTALPTALYTAEFGAHLPVLDDHRLHRMVVVPAACYLSMLLSAGREVLGSATFAVREAFFSRALILGDEERRAVQLAIEPGVPGQAGFRVFSRTEAAKGREAGEWVQHAQGMLSAGGDGSDAAPAVDLDAVRARCPSRYDAETFYAELWAREFHLGPRFRWLSEIWYDAGRAVARLREPQSIDSAGQAVIPPGLIDSCFQLLSATVGFEAAADATYVPIRIEVLRAVALERQPRWAIATLRPGEAPTRELLVGDIRVLDADNRPVIDILGLHIKRAGKAALLQNAEAVPLLAVRWQALEEPAPVVAGGETWVLAHHADPAVPELTRLLEERGARCVTLPLGVDGAAGEAAVTERLLTALRPLAGEASPTHIVYLPGAEGAPVDQEALAGSHARIGGGALHLIHAVIRTPWTTRPQLWLVTREACAVAADDPPVNLAHAPLWGLGRVLAQEHPELRGGLIDLPVQVGPEALDGLVRAITASGGEDQLALRGGRRFVARLDRTTPARGASIEEEPRLSPEGAYLITGGLGGLGLAVARWMVGRGARRLLLLGRRPPDARAREVLAELAGQGARVEALQVDVADAGALARCLGSLGEVPLRGVIHAAGVLDDGVLLQQDWPRMRAVLAPKVAGAWNLHLLTRGFPLDFFVLFGSIASVLGTPGQGSYAAANGFLAALAHHRRALGLRASCIEWGPWAEVGMAARTSAAHPWSGQGLSALAVDEALRALGRILVSGLPEVVVAAADWPTLVRKTAPGASSRMLADLAGAVTPVEAGPAAASRPTLADELAAALPGERADLLAAHVRSVIAAVMRLDTAAHLAPGQVLFDAGLDSLMAIEIQRRLQADIGRPLSSTLIFDHPTVASIAGHLAQVLGLTAEAKVPAPAAKASPPVARPASPPGAEGGADLNALSRQELEAVLLEELKELDG